MLLFSLFFALGLAVEEDRELGARVDFVERSVLNILVHGHFPQMYNSSFPMIRECGCYYSPSKIRFGSQIGLACQRLYPDENPPYDEESCGQLCNDPHGLDITLFCPHGWDSSCERGCFPPEKFKTVEERIDFWELTLTSLLIHGWDYIMVASEYLEKCGCDGKVRPIRYGTQIGFDCVMGEDKSPSEDCAASSQCADDSGRQIVTFCPAGHAATCDGCSKTVMNEGDDPHDNRVRADWMIHVVVGYARETLKWLGWEPNTRQLLDCGCTKGVVPVTYGRALGYYCPIRSGDEIKVGCGPNVICSHPEEGDILHFCPDGFIPSCDLGCSFPWEGKDHDEL